ncbi:MAG: O-antigen ligase family protein [Vicinamibacterales bacterium]
MSTSSRTLWIVAVCAVAAAAAGAVLPPMAFLGLVVLLVMAAAAAAAIVLRVDRPSIGLLLLMGTAVAFPVEFRGPAGVMMSSSLPLSAAICGLWIVRSLLAGDASAFDRSRVVVAAVLFLGLTLVSFTMGQFPWFHTPGAPLPAQVVELGLFSLSVCLFLAVGQQVHRLAELQWLTWLFVAAGAVTCVLQMTPALLPVARWTTRPGSVGSLFWTWFVAVTVAHGLANSQLRLPIRLGLLGLAGLALGHSLLQVRSWASGWAPALIAVGAITLVRWPRLVVGGGLLATPLAYLLAGDILAPLLADEAYSLMTRQEAWKVLMQIVDRNPWLGTGLANYYYYAENFPILGWYVTFISHNNYQDLLVQTGLLGLAAFLWFGLEALWMTFRLSLQCPPGFPTAYALAAFGGTLGSLASGMLGDWIIPFYYNGGVLGFRSSLLFWVFLGGALSLRRMLAATRQVHAVERTMSHVPGEYALATSR